MLALYNVENPNKRQPPKQAVHPSGFTSISFLYSWNIDSAMVAFDKWLFLQKGGQIE